MHIAVLNQDEPLLAALLATEDSIALTAESALVGISSTWAQSGSDYRVWRFPAAPVTLQDGDANSLLAAVALAGGHESFIVPPARKRTLHAIAAAVVDRALWGLAVDANWTVALPADATPKSCATASEESCFWADGTWTDLLGRRIVPRSFAAGETALPAPVSDAITPVLSTTELPTAPWSPLAVPPAPLLHAAGPAAANEHGRTMLAAAAAYREPALLTALLDGRVFDAIADDATTEQRRERASEARSPSVAAGWLAPAPAFAGACRCLPRACDTTAPATNADATCGWSVDATAGRALAAARCDHDGATALAHALEVDAYDARDEDLKTRTVKALRDGAERQAAEAQRAWTLWRENGRAAWLDARKAVMAHYAADQTK